MDSMSLGLRAKCLASTGLFGTAAAAALWMLATAPGSDSFGVLPATALAFFVATSVSLVRARGSLFRMPLLSVRALFRALLAGCLLAASTAFLVTAARMGAPYLACVAFTAGGVVLAPVFRRLTWGGHLSLAQRCGALLGLAAGAPWLAAHPSANGLLFLSALFQSIAFASWSPAHANDAPRHAYWFWALLGGGVITSIAAILLQSAIPPNAFTANVRIGSLAHADLRALYGIVSLGAILALRLNMLADAGRSLSGGNAASVWIFTLIVSATTLAGLHQLPVTPVLFASLPAMLIGVMLARISLREGMSFRGLIGLPSTSDAVSSPVA